MVGLRKVLDNAEIRFKKTGLGQFLNPSTQSSGSYVTLVQQQDVGFRNLFIFYLFILFFAFSINICANTHSQHEIVNSMSYGYVG